MADCGLGERVGRGGYRGVNAAVGIWTGVETSLRAPRATICLVSGLVEHDLVDDNLAVLDVALPRETWLPRLAVPVRWHSFDRDVRPGPGRRPGLRDR